MMTYSRNSKYRSFWDKVGLKDLKDDDIQPEFEIPQAFIRN